MDLNRINKKILILLCMMLVFINALSINSVYASDDSPVGTNFNIYSYEFISNNEKIQELINQCENMDIVKNGSYTYFIGCIGYSQNEYQYEYILINNNYLYDLQFLPLTSYNSTVGAYDFRLLIYLSSNVLDLAGNYETMYHKLYNNGVIKDSSNGNSPGFLRTSTVPDNHPSSCKNYCLMFYSYGFYSSLLGENGGFSVPFVTNYTKNIYGTNNNSGAVWETGTFPIRNSEPYLLNSLSSLPTMNFDTLGIMQGTIPSSSVNFSIINTVTNEECISINMKDYTEYISRSDVDNPFSPLSYNIPLKVIPDFSLDTLTRYDFQVSYNIGNATVFNHNYVTVTVDYNHNQTEQPITPGGGEGGEQGGETEKDTSNKELQNAIEESTDKIIESNKETQNKLEEQTEAIKEGNETKKNIFEKIGDILSYINPFSENFFGRKLVELIIEGLKSLFVPSNDFMVEFFGGLSDWFQERLGFLWTPFDIVNTFLEKLYDSEFGEPIIHIPNIQEPFTGVTLISSSDINLNDIRNNETFKNIHDIYLVLIDFAVYIGLIVLSYNTLVGVFRGSPDSITVVEPENDRAFRQAQFADKVKSFRKRG